MSAIKETNRMLKKKIIGLEVQMKLSWTWGSRKAYLKRQHSTWDLKNEKKLANCKVLRKSFQAEGKAKTKTMWEENLVYFKKQKDVNVAR